MKALTVICRSGSQRPFSQMRLTSSRRVAKIRCSLWAAKKSVHFKSPATQDLKKEASYHWSQSGRGEPYSQTIHSCAPSAVKNNAASHAAKVLKESLDRFTGWSKERI